MISDKLRKISEDVIDLAEHIEGLGGHEKDGEPIRVDFECCFVKFSWNSRACPMALGSKDYGETGGWMSRKEALKLYRLIGRLLEK